MGGIDLKHLKIKMKSMTTKVKCPFITKSEPIRAQYSFFSLANNLKTFVTIIILALTRHETVIFWTSIKILELA